jgi:Spy/CpxP family protein refolding chaperone
MKLNQRLMVAGAAALLALGLSQSALAQQDNPPGGGRPGGGGRGNFDPAQFRQRMMDRMKEQLEVTDDAEWKALEPLVQNVMEARRGTMSGMGRGMFVGGPRRGGGDNAAGGGGDQPRRGGMGQSSPEADALQKAIDAKAPKAEVKAALDKFIASRKAKQAELEKAQDELRKVLTSRQEAIATLDGLL